MIFSTLTLTLAVCTCSASFLLSSDGYAIKSFRLSIPDSYNATYTSTISFSLQDTEPLAPDLAICMASWNSASIDWPFDDSYETCSIPSYSFFIKAANLLGPNVTFTLEAKHIYLDPSIGDPPFVTTFARAAFVSGTNITCFPFSKNRYDCLLNPETNEYLQIWGATA